MQTLNNENRTLRDELQRLSEECEKLTSENSSIKVKYSPSIYALSLTPSNPLLIERERVIEPFNFLKQEELTRFCGPEALANFEKGNAAPPAQSRGGEGKD